MIYMTKGKLSKIRFL